MNISDIAKMARVSKSTVSRYLNGGSVSTKTRNKIDEIVKETGYSPNQFAQSLKAKKTFMIGAIIPRLDSYAINQTLEGAEKYLRKIKYQTLIVNTNQDKNLEVEALYTLDRNKVDGIMLLATEITKEHIKAIQEIKAPVILVGQSCENIPSVIQNDFSAGRKIGEVFGRKYFNKVAYLGVEEYDQSVGIERKSGVLKGLSTYHIKPDIYYTDFDLRHAEKAARNIVSKYDAIICGTDNIALGVLKAAHHQQIEVPSQLSISGFGGYDTTSIVSPTITTIAFPYKKTGEIAGQNLIKLINEEKIEILQVMDFQFIENNSIDIK